MHICIVMEYHPDDLTGGAEVQVFGLARRFVAAGHEVSYVCQRYDRSRPTDAVVDGVRVLRVLAWRRVFRFLVALCLIRTVKGLRPDLVYQRFASPLTGIAAWAARSLRVPFVWGCSQDESLEPGFLLRARPKPSGGPGGWAKALLLRINAQTNQRLFSWGVRHAGAIVVQNPRQLELVRSNFGRSARVIANGIDVPPLAGAKEPEPLVLWLNRIAKGKNAEGFIELAASLQADHPTVRFVLVGGRQNDRYMEEIRTLAARVENLELTGGVPQSEVRGWMERAWVYVLTSTSEGFPNVLLQAWAAGTPVVSLEVDPGGVIQGEGMGLLSGTPEGLRRDVERLIADPAQRAQLAAAAHAYVSEHFEFGRIAGRYLDLFQQLTGRPESTSAPR